MRLEPIPNMDGYFATDDGRIFKEVKGRETTGGYLSAHVGRGIDKKIHRLIAETFIPNPDNLPMVNHINGNKKKNDIGNLEWTDRSGNVKHAYDNGLIDKSKISDSLRKYYSSEIIK